MFQNRISGSPKKFFTNISHIYIYSILFGFFWNVCMLNWNWTKLGSRSWWGISLCGLPVPVMIFEVFKFYYFHPLWWIFLRLDFYVVLVDSTSGPLAVDESVTLAQSVGTGNPNTLSFWLLPQPHGSAGKEATLKHRRLLEDKVIKCPVTISIVIIFKILLVEFRGENNQTMLNHFGTNQGQWIPLRSLSTTRIRYIKEIAGRSLNSAPWL